MPRDVHKSAAVPFVNQKGERSMKRVKVERYVAGKKPSYANDEDDEYYTTDEEASEDNEQNHTPFIKQEDRKLSLAGGDSDDEDDDEEEEEKPNERIAAKQEVLPESDDEDDDPRFRRLKEIEAKQPSIERLINVQQSHLAQPGSNELSNHHVVIDDDDEDEIRERHAIARRRQLEEPLGPQAIFGDSGGDVEDAPNKHSHSNILHTDDLLKDFKLTGLNDSCSSPIQDETDEEREAELAKEEEEKFIQKLNKKVEEDLRRELEREALAKGDIGAREMSSVKTDDEDEELAYEEWKLREIKRVLRDRSERMLESREPMEAH